ncbi:hypothetical protein RHSIM_RhsimUnG0014300 [Rhododendron simsii]|uniref:Pentatricopeptide repeat-containing protein n=1 Tax=Rhododendron simsii TaxID=118357 RepID=A0A834FWA6_RHOSS|nr:hypothetical protein RHSIM_RhsimUnG0014300 [Rhododendron simsii]
MQMPSSSSSIHSLIYACSKLNNFKQQVLSLFSRLLYKGSHVPEPFSSPQSSRHALLFPTSKLDDSQLKVARKLLDAMSEPDVVSWSALVVGYARLGHVSEAKEVFEDMENERIEPNIVCCNGLIAGFNQMGDLEDLILGNQIHGYVIKMGTVSDKCIVSALIDMYGKCGCGSQMSQVFDEMDALDVGACSALVSGLSRNGLVDEALMVFRQSKDKGVDLNVVSWTSVIAACSQNGKDMEALDLSRGMQIAGVKPNSITIPCLLPACGNTATLIHGKAAHGFWDL